MRISDWSSDVCSSDLTVMNRSARGAWWLALGCGMGLVNIGLEFLLRQQTDPVPVSIGIFLVYLSAISFVLIGIARHYRAEPPWIAMTEIGRASCRERVGQNVLNSVVAVSLKKK